MFGTNYTPVESTPSIDSGYYQAKIIRAELKTNSIGQYLEIEVTIKDHQGCNPKIALLNDYPMTPYGSLSLEDSQRIWNQNMTKFFDNFKINRGDFNFPMWINHVGEVTVRPQKKNPQYKELILWHDKLEQKQSAPTPQTSAAAPSNAQIPNAPFDEDIPF